MATVSYYFNYLNYVSPLNTYTDGYQYANSIGSMSNGGFFPTFSGYYSGGGYNYVDARPLNSSGAPVTSNEIAAATYGAASARDSHVTGINNGNVGVAYTSTQASTPSSVHTNLYSPAGSLVRDVTVSANADSPDIGRLTDGGFVVSYNYNFSSTDVDTYAKVFNADGSLRTTVVANAQTYTTTNSVTAGLQNGNFVVAYSKQEAVGSTNYDLAFRIYNAAGNPVLDETIADGVGKWNAPGQMIGLKDGGFAIAYQDTGWSSGDSDYDITLGIWNANGTFRNWVHANAPASSAETGYQYSPTVTQLDNGYIAVGWTSVNQTEYSVWTPSGGFVNMGTWLGSTSALALASSAGGVLSGVTTNTTGDGSGYGVSSYTVAFSRATSGDATSEHLTGDSLRDYMTGGAGNDTILGLNANDTLDGGTGNDNVDAGAGNDLVYGSAGADNLIGGAGYDTVSYLTSLAAVRVNLASLFTNTGDALGDHYSGFEKLEGTSYNDTLIGDGLANYLVGADGNDSVSGGVGNDSLDGIYGNDTLDGGAGNDRLDGGGNDDLLIGGAGADRLTGGSGIDTVSYQTATVGVRANLASPGANTGDALGDTYAAVENLLGSNFNDTLIGSVYNNRVDGGLGNDSLDGGVGNDTLIGGAGNDSLLASAGFDQLTGGVGADKFYFTSPSAQFDTISDFSRGQADKLVLTHGAFGGITALNSTNFIANGAPGSPSGSPTLLYNTLNGNLSFDPDGTGATAAIKFAVLTGHPTLTAADILFV